MFLSENSTKSLLLIARICSYPALVLGTLLFPWWVVALLLVVAIFCLPFYIEGVFVGLVMDILYASPTFEFGIFGIFFTWFAVVVLVTRVFVVPYIRIGI